MKSFRLCLLFLALCASLLSLPAFANCTVPRHEYCEDALDFHNCHLRNNERDQSYSECANREREERQQETERRYQEERQRQERENQQRSRTYCEKDQYGYCQ